MTRNKLALALSLMLFAVPLSAFAQDAATETANPAQSTGEVDQAPAAAPAAEEEDAPALTWNLALTTDYVFRGVSQTDRDPALQGGLDYAFGDTGIYVGAWASNVDFADSEGPDLELDSYIGWSHDLSEDWNVDLSFVHYAYLGESEDYGSANYNELIGKTTWNEMVTATVAYTDDYTNSGVSSWYFNLGGTWDVGNDFSVNAGFGHTEFEDDVFENYNDWNIGVSRQFGPVNAALNYYDVDIDGPRVSDAVVFTLGLGN
jgi:uncharacterized protein (TIGR02001 family)